MPFLDEKHRSTFANILHLLIQVPLLTNSAFALTWLANIVCFYILFFFSLLCSGKDNLWLVWRLQPNKTVEEEKTFLRQSGIFFFSIIVDKRCQLFWGKTLHHVNKRCQLFWGRQCCLIRLLCRELVYLVLPQWVDPLNVKSLILLCSIYIEESKKLQYHTSLVGILVYSVLPEWVNPLNVKSLIPLNCISVEGKALAVDSFSKVLLDLTNSWKIVLSIVVFGRC